MINPDRFSELRRSHGKPRQGLHPVTKLSADLLRCPPCQIVELMAFTDALGKFAVVGFAAAGTVRTASATQVRQPIYRHALGRWHRYQEFLEPLLHALNGAGAKP